MTGLRYSPLHVTELCGEMQGKFKVGCARLRNRKNQCTTMLLLLLLQRSMFNSLQNRRISGAEGDRRNANAERESKKPLYFPPVC